MRIWLSCTAIVGRRTSADGTPTMATVPPLVARWMAATIVGWMATQSKTTSALSPRAARTWSMTSAADESTTASAPCRLVARDREREQADGAAAHDDDGLVLQRTGDTAGVHRRRERFDERCCEIVDVVGDDMQPVRADDEFVGHTALKVSAAEELQVLAQVLLTQAALLTVPARQGRLDRHPVSHGKGRHVRPDLGDDTGDLVPGVVGDRDQRMAAVQRVSVRAAHAGG